MAATGKEYSKDTPPALIILMDTWFSFNHHASVPLSDPMIKMKVEGAIH